MSTRIEAEQKAWAMYFNPCGIEPVNGFVHQTCVSPDCMRVHCMSKGAYAMARYLLGKETDIEEEKSEFENHLKSNMLGKEIVRVSGETVRVSTDNISQIVDEVAQKAETIAQETDMCVRMSTPLSEEYLANCTPEQRDALDRLGDKAKFLGSYEGGKYYANIHETETQKIVEEALDLGLGGLGLIARYAIGFGLGDRVPQYSMSQVFKHPGTGQLQERLR